MRKRDDRRGRHAAKDRRGGGAAAEGEIIYGWHSALAALHNPERTVKRVLATRNAVERLSQAGLPALPDPVEAREIDRIAGPGAVHQGILLVADPLPEKDVEDLGAGQLVVVLDQVTDPHNVGAILRSAAAHGADAVVITERHGPAAGGLLAKAASGALEHVALVRVTNLARALDRLGTLGFERLGLDSGHAEPIEAIEPGARVAIVLGAEGKGLRRLTKEHCDRLVRLDMPGPIKSLNVSNAAAVALYALRRRMG